MSKKHHGALSIKFTAYIYKSKSIRYAKIDYFVSLFTGIRLGEVLVLSWPDLREKTRMLHIHRDLERIQVFDDPTCKSKLIAQSSAKSRRSNRDVAIPDEVYAMLMLHKRVQAQQNLPNPLNLMFPSKNGTYTDPRTYQKRVEQVAKRAGLKDVSVHTLRHTFATRLAEKNIHLTLLKEIMVHSSVKTTEKYIHLAKDLQRAAVNTLNRFVSGVAVAETEPGAATANTPTICS